MNKFFKVIGAVAIINIVARMFGFLREMVIGIQYGSSDYADSIFTAYTIPNFLYLAVGGAFTTAVISIYNRENTNRPLFVKQSFTIVLFTTLILTAIMMFFADSMLHLFDTANEEKPEQIYVLAAKLYYWMMPSSVLLVLSSWYSGLLNLHDKFHLSSFAILIYNAAFLIIGVALSVVIGPFGYGVSALLSAVIMLFFLILGYRKLKSHPVGISFTHNMATKELWLMVLPLVIGGATIQFYALLHRLFATGLGAGAISSVNYASRLMQFPQAILITAVTTVIYPVLSRKEGENDIEGIRSLYSKGLHYLLLLLLPVTVYSYFYSTNLIQIVFQYGQFNEQSTAMTAPVFAIFALSMYFLAANMYITRFYYAKGNSLAPVIYSIVNVIGINIFVMVYFSKDFGAVAIAWGTLISSFTNYLMLVLHARFKYKLKFGMFDREANYLRAWPPFILITLIVYLSSTYLQFDNKFLTFFVGVAIFGSSLVALYWLFGIQEFKELVRKLLAKFGKSKKDNA